MSESVNKNDQEIDHGESEETNVEVRSQSVNLLETISKMSTSLNSMKEIIQKTNFIALNASIEAARTQTQTENFSLVADQVRRQGERTEELSSALAQKIEELQVKALKAIAVNFTDVANDIIDKIDRNLFERNCDMQAWAGFKEIVDCCVSMRGKRDKDISSEIESKGDQCAAIDRSNKKLSSLVETYNVYVDSLLINDMGFVISTACNGDLIGRDWSQTEIFRAVKSTDEIYVTDMHHNRDINSNTVIYCCPVHNDAGELIGAVANCFNWDYVQEILSTIPINKEVNLQIVSSNGTLIGSRSGHGLLNDTLTWSMAGTATLDQASGYTIECERNGRLNAWGYCHTFGYNAYKGKNWSAIVNYPLSASSNVFMSEQISRDFEKKRQAAPRANRTLQRVASQIEEHVKSINTINNETNMLAVNAAIQAGVAGAEGEAFSVIASEIGQLAKQSEEFVTHINSLTESLERGVKETVYNRLGDAAFDCIDKIDRNLYERNCDVKAFAGFHEIEEFLVKGGENTDTINLLRKLHEIYEVYHEIILLDRDGIIKATAMHKELIGQNQSDRDWFREAVQDARVVTDFYFSKTIDDYTVTYAAPVHDADGKVIGVVSTRFNCNFIFDIMKSTIVNRKAEVFLVNSKGVVIGSPTGDGLLEDSFTHTMAYRLLDRKELGYTLEVDQKHGGGNFAFGYAKTKGYINYKGNGWAVIIRQEIEDAIDEEKQKPLAVA